MWQFRTSRSFGISGFFWPALWALVCALGSCEVEAATSYQWSAASTCAGSLCPDTQTATSPMLAGAAVVAWLNSNCAVTTSGCNEAAGCTSAHPCSFAQGTGWTFGTFPTFGASATVVMSGGASATLGLTFSTIANSTPGQCSAAGTAEDIYTQAGITGSVCGSDGCLYAAGPATYIVNSPPGTHWS